MRIDPQAFSTCRVLVIGDLMIDEYLWGDVERISPEAPVQVVDVRSEEFTLGGAGNVVNNLVALGASVSVAGVVGPGRDGRTMLDMFNEIGVNTKGILPEDHRPTTRKTRIIAANQHVLRIDRETRAEVRPATMKRLKKFIAKRIPMVDVVLISDYGKGLITRDLVASVVETARNFEIPVIADPKGLDFSKYAGVTLLTPNQKEAGMAAGIQITDDDLLADAAYKILQQVNIEQLLITRGKDGMALYDRDGETIKTRAAARQVFDVSGAGDTVIAVLGLGLALDGSMEDAMALANAAAGIVVGKVGTATVSAGELESALGPSPDRSLLKRKHVRELPALVREIRKQGRRIVLTNGCFDLLHAGHVRLFAESRRMGDVLIVALDDDAAVRRLKGPDRPVIKLDERVALLCAMDSIDYVVVFSTGKLERLIEIIQPNVLTKGSDYTPGEVAGRELVERYGGRVEMIPISDDLSSSRIIQDIREN